MTGRRVTDDLPVALRAALAGSEVGLRHFAALAELPVERKSDGSVVTEADRAVEAAVRRVLAEARPADAVLGEEAGATGRGSRRWIVDPIDGTAMFVAGDDRWLVLVALEEAGEIVAGVAVVPAQGRIWWAERGGGAFTAPTDDLTRPRRITVARRDPDTLAGSRLGVVPTADQLLPPERDMIRELTEATVPTPWPAHAALLVADGRLDLAVQTRGEVWDFAAPSIIVEEAGGCFSDLQGRRRPSPGPALYARSRAVQEAALRMLVARPAS